ncbi:cytidine deaminase [Dokdonella sp.]|uniref:cytidine deaminase n=1 Tax=Dokdonella sp. TaxID=2291710 RepID=UPI00378410B9
MKAATTRAAVEAEFPGLIAAAETARLRAYAPHSDFHVGAALLFDDGRGERFVGGCNVESDVYGLTICAERNALFAAVAQGRGEPLALAVVADTDEPVAPCGACRQVLHECDPLRRMRVFLVAGAGDAVRETSTAALLPGAFVLDTGDARRRSPWR